MDINHLEKDFGRGVANSGAKSLFCVCYGRFFLLRRTNGQPSPTSAPLVSQQLTPQKIYSMVDKKKLLWEPRLPK